MTRTLALFFVASLFATGCNEHPLEQIDYEHETGMGESGSGTDGEDDTFDLDDSNDSAGGTGGGDDDGFGLTSLSCGDGQVDPGEECDHGDDNDDFGACTGECREAVCGDGLVYEGVEECDDGDMNGEYDPSGYCSNDCTRVDL